MVRQPGVLRKVVPGWLSGAELGRFVIGFQQALPRDGGGGALYVLLRLG
jgi:DNA-nicking Smr family endonuclease